LRFCLFASGRFGHSRNRSPPGRIPLASTSTHFPKNYWSGKSNSVYLDHSGHAGRLNITPSSQESKFPQLSPPLVFIAFLTKKISGPGPPPGEHPRAFSQGARPDARPWERTPGSLLLSHGPTSLVNPTLYITNIIY